MNINDQHIRRVRGDGIIVGTATGSTAYLLAAGSPIIMPELKCMIVTGLNEYDFRSRPLVISVSIKPGATALTVMPLLANSLAALFVSPITPDFDEA